MKYRNVFNLHCQSACHCTVRTNGRAKFNRQSTNHCCQFLTTKPSRDPLRYSGILYVWPKLELDVEKLRCNCVWKWKTKGTQVRVKKTESVSFFSLLSSLLSFFLIFRFCLLLKLSIPVPLSTSLPSSISVCDPYIHHRRRASCVWRPGIPHLFIPPCICLMGCTVHETVHKNTSTCATD